MMSPDRQAAKRVLVVDDNTFASGLLVALLRLEGYEAEAVEDGQQALLRLRWWRPDLILLDLAMPVMDGWEFLRLRRGDLVAGRIPVVVLSATDEALFGVARDLGAARVLRKPAGGDDLLAAVGRHC
jgi:CheY-like chemotaxis protein